MSADLKLVNGDLSIENGLLVLIYDDEALIQRLRIRLETARGEWFKNTEIGTDWFGSILGKRSDIVRKAELRRVLRETESVAEVLRLELSHEKSTRTLSVDFTVLAESGRTLDVRFEDLLG